MFHVKKKMFHDGWSSPSILFAHLLELRWCCPIVILGTLELPNHVAAASVTAATAATDISTQAISIDPAETTSNPKLLKHDFLSVQRPGDLPMIFHIKLPTINHHYIIQDTPSQKARPVDVCHGFGKGKISASCFFLSGKNMPHCWHDISSKTTKTCKLRSIEHEPRPATNI